MDSLLNDSCRVAFAGLIYNLDTLFQRANLKGESPADALRSILGRAPVLEGETAPFSPQGSDEANGETLETCKSSKDHSKPRNEVDTSLKSPV